MPDAPRCSRCCEAEAAVADLCLPCAYLQPESWWEAWPVCAEPDEDVLGRTEPLHWTRPLRPLTPATSLGFECVAFAYVVLGIRLAPWQAWFLIHALEINPDGKFRFRTIILLVARQNGKTTVMQVLTLWLMFTRQTFVVGTAQDLDVAREAWNSVRFKIKDDPDLSEYAPRGYVTTGNGKEEIRLTNGARYKVKATTEDSARGIPGVGCLLLDELRTHRDYKAYSALSNTAMANPEAIEVGMSNAGSADSVVLNELWAAALEGGDDAPAAFGWQAPTDDCDDVDGWAQANPALGYGRLTMRALRNARRKSRMSPQARAVFLVENLCRWVETMNAAVDGVLWLGRRFELDVAAYRGRRMHGGLDVSLDGRHASLVIATEEPDGTVRAWLARSWDDLTKARDELPSVLAALDLRTLSWIPSGPAAALGAIVRQAGRKPKSIRGTELLEVNGSRVAEACMGLDAAIRAAAFTFSEPGEVMQEQVKGCSRRVEGDRWVFTRQGVGQADAAYALAIALQATLGARRRRPGGTDAAPAEPPAPEPTRATARRRPARRT